MVWVQSPLSCVWLFAVPWTVASQAPLSMEFSRQEYWSGLPWPPPGDLPNPGIGPSSLVSPALPGRFFTTSAPWEALMNDMCVCERMCVCVCVCMCTHSCPTLCNPMDYSPPGPYVHGISQAWIPVQFSRSVVSDSYQSEFLFPSPGDLPDLGIKPASFSFPALAGRFFTTVPPGKPPEWEGWISKTVLESQAWALHSYEILLGQVKRWWWT